MLRMSQICFFFFQLDEVEYALPASEAPTLAEVLSTEEEEVQNSETKYIEDTAACSALQVEFLQGISQQLLQAQVCTITQFFMKKLFKLNYTTIK